MNIVMLIGNLTNDPEVKYTPTGKSVTEFGIAVNESWRDASGQQQQEVYFAQCVFWGERGEKFAQYHQKGERALVHGKLKNDSWEDKETGKKMSKTRIVVHSFEFVKASRSDDGGDTSQRRQTSPAPRQQQSQQRTAPRPRQQERRADDDFDGPISDGMDDEIPF